MTISNLAVYLNAIMLLTKNNFLNKFVRVQLNKTTPFLHRVFLI